jgi:hypothetical protein
MDNMLGEIVLLDVMGNSDACQSKIDNIAYHTGLPILESKYIGLDGLKNVLLDAVQQNQRKRAAKIKDMKIESFERKVKP